MRLFSTYDVNHIPHEVDSSIWLLIGCLGTNIQSECLILQRHKLCVLLKSCLNLKFRVCVHLARQCFAQKLPVWFVLNNEVNECKRRWAPRAVSNRVRPSCSLKPCLPLTLVALKESVLLCRLYVLLNILTISALWSFLVGRWQYKSFREVGTHPHGLLFFLHRDIQDSSMVWKKWRKRQRNRKPLKSGKSWNVSKLLSMPTSLARQRHEVIQLAGHLLGRKEPTSWC